MGNMKGFQIYYVAFHTSNSQLSVLILLNLFQLRNRRQFNMAPKTAAEAERAPGHTKERRTNESRNATNLRIKDCTKPASETNCEPQSRWLHQRHHSFCRRR